MPRVSVTSRIWDASVRDAADPARAREAGLQIAPLLPQGYFEALSVEQGRVLAALFSGSLALTELLCSKHDWIAVTAVERLRDARRIDGLRREVAAFLEPALQKGDYASAFRQLREFKQREFLRIGARDLAGFGTVSEVTEEISNVADLCIHSVCLLVFNQLLAKFGTPYVQDPVSGKWLPAAFCVLGMGKHGGQELNYSSDIDVLFVYSGEGQLFRSAPGTTSKKASSMSNSHFYARLCEAIIGECTRMTAEGFLFRIDLRLRPEGKTAPLARSLGSYETYYSQWGQTWERMMLIKARGVGGDPVLAAEFLEMVQPFRYPRSISEQIPREVAEMKQRIENEVVRSGELERNVKLGRGGIREIEFLVQTLQVLHAGRQPFLQGSKTLPTIEKLSRYHLLDAKEAALLRDAYCFLRKVEHRLQMEDNRQTHTLPVGPEARTRIARLMGFPTLGGFDTELAIINDSVRQAYDKVVKSGRDQAGILPREVAQNESRWSQILAEHSFRDPKHGVNLVRDFVEGPGFGHRSSRTIDNSLELLSTFLVMCPKKGINPPEPFLSDPDRVLTRLAAFITAYGARTMLYEAWVANPSLFRLLLMAFDRSEFLAELAIRVPDLIDEIEQSGQLRRRKTAEQILEDLRPGAADPDQHLWLRRYFQAEQMRIGLRDILDLANPEQTQTELTELADAFLTYSLEVVLRKHRLRKSPFAIFGLGKLGGRELIYASDLDIIFVAEDSVKNLPALQKIAAELMDLLSARTAQGTTFNTDARLRPDGDKGLLVNTVSGFTGYYKKRAMLWEIQSLTRARAIAGNAEVMEIFIASAQEITDFSKKRCEIAAFIPAWKQEVHKMRMRIEKERTPAGKGSLAIKTGSGGLMDVEFVAQAICLDCGWHESNTLAAIERARHQEVLSAGSAERLARNYRRLMQIERILRRWSFEAESVLPDLPAPFYRVAVRCGFAQPDEFFRAIQECRAEIRSEYVAYFNLR